MSLVGFKAQNHEQQVGRRGALDKVDDRRTPRSLFDPLNEVHRFDLDVAASRENALCGRYFTIAQDGLRQRWNGRVWCNPPYSDCGAWVAKAHLERHNVDLIVMLLPANRTEQSWWQEYVEPYRDSNDFLSAHFLAGRLRFDVPDGTYTDPRGNRPPFGCVVLKWRGHPALATESALQRTTPGCRCGVDSTKLPHDPCCPAVLRPPTPEGGAGD